MATISLPYKFTSVSLDAGNTDSFGIDPEQTIPIDAGNTDPFFVDREQTTPIDIGNTDPFGVDHEQTTLERFTNELRIAPRDVDFY